MKRVKALQTALFEKRQEILRTLGVKFDTMATLGRVAEDDQAQISHDEFISLHLNSLEYAKLRLVNEALDRLNRGDYGICQRCDEPISEKRLNAVPWAAYCLKCQEAAAAETPVGAQEREDELVGSV